MYKNKINLIETELAKYMGRLYATHLINKLKNKAIEKTDKNDIVEVKVDISKYLGEK